MTHSPAKPKELKTILAFTAVYLGGAVLVSWQRGNSEFVFYIGVMIVLVATLIPLHRRVGLSAGVLWGLTIWGLLHMAGGLVQIPDSWKDEGASNVLYNLRFFPGGLKYDQVIHFFGFGITTWLCWQTFSAKVKNFEGGELQPTPGLMILCAAAGMGFGSLNEVIEFFATLLIPDTNVGGYENTSWDMVSNLAGAATAGIVIFVTGKPRS